MADEYCAYHGHSWRDVAGYPNDQQCLVCCASRNKVKDPNENAAFLNGMVEEAITEAAVLPCGHVIGASYEDSTGRIVVACLGDHQFHGFIYKGFLEWMPEAEPRAELTANLDAAYTDTEAAAEAERESMRRQRANFNAVTDGMAPPYPSEY